MKNFNYQLRLTFLVFILLFPRMVLTQNAEIIKGELYDKQNKQPVAFASIVLYAVKDSSQIAGTMSDINGKFILQKTTSTKAFLKISHVKYTRKKMAIKSDTPGKTQRIGLSSNMITMDEIVIAEKRKKAANSGNKTTFYMNETLEETSSTGIDVIKNLPGVHVDLMQNVSLGNKQNIILVVDGKKRDIDFLKQLDAASINKIEIDQSPGASYGAETGGVININLKKTEHGVSGHINAEIPVNPSEIFLFPDASISYTNKKVRLFASYNGEFSYFKIHENKSQKINTSYGINQSQTKEILNQENWSHRLNYGVDFNASKNSTLNYYGYYNPYSNEHNGETTITTNETELQARRKDEDLHQELFNAFFLEKKLKKRGKFRVDFNHYYMRGNSKITYRSEETNENLINTISTPMQSSYYLKTSYNYKLNSHWDMQTGLNSRYEEVKDLQSANFNYTKLISACYAQANISTEKVQTVGGLRIEHEKSAVKNRQSGNTINFLPHLSMDYKINNSQKLSLIYRKSIKRPNRYELNPMPYAAGIDQIYKGNTDLVAEKHHYAGLGYHLNNGQNYYSGKLYYTNTRNYTDRFYYLNDEAIYGEYQNIGVKQTYGFEVQGAQNLYSFLTLYHSINLFSSQIQPKKQFQNPENKRKAEPGLIVNLSAIFSMGNNLKAKATFQYSSPSHKLQATTYSDALYFISLQKKWDNNLKLEITSGVPFRKNFTYQGHNINAENFSSSYNGKIQLSGFPVWIKISYQFSKGKKQNPVDIPKQSIKKPKKGF